MYKHKGRSVRDIVKEKYEGIPYERAAQPIKGINIGRNLKQSTESVLQEKDFEVKTAQVQIAEIQVGLSQARVDADIKEQAMAFREAVPSARKFNRTPTAIAKLAR